MGWDNASTIAAEVEEPQHTYPRAHARQRSLIVAVSYILPVRGHVADRTSVPQRGRRARGPTIAGMLGGPLLRIAPGARRQ